MLRAFQPASRVWPWQWSDAYRVISSDAELQQIYDDDEFSSIFDLETIEDSFHVGDRGYPTVRNSYDQSVWKIQPMIKGHKIAMTARMRMGRSESLGNEC